MSDPGLSQPLCSGRSHHLQLGQKHPLLMERSLGIQGQGSHRFGSWEVLIPAFLLCRGSTLSIASNPLPPLQRPHLQVPSHGVSMKLPNPEVSAPLAGNGLDRRVRKLQ